MYWTHQNKTMVLEDKFERENFARTVEAIRNHPDLQRWLHGALRRKLDEKMLQLTRQEMDFDVRKEDYARMSRWHRFWKSVPNPKHDEFDYRFLAGVTNWTWAHNYEVEEGVYPNEVDRGTWLAYTRVQETPEFMPFNFSTLIHVFLTAGPLHKKEHDFYYPSGYTEMRRYDKDMPMLEGVHYSFAMTHGYRLLKD